MTVKLVPMTEDECTAYIEQGVIEYAEEHIKNGMSPEIAREHYEKTYADLLPDGPNSKDQYLFTVKSGDEAVGMVWFAEMNRGGQRGAYVYGIIIYEEHRRNGYGSATFTLMEEKVRELGLDRIRLHVFGHNHGAIAMYQKLGYETTNIHMDKRF